MLEAMASPQLWLVRHGETEWSASGRHTGSTDIPLTDQGRDAARRLARVLSGHAFAEVLTSPMSRAQDTCALAGLGERAIVTDDLREWDYGDYEGVTTDEIRNTRPGWTIFADGGGAGGETADQVAARADRVVAQARQAAGDTIVFSHGHLLRVLAARWIGLPSQAGAHLALSTASVSTLGWEREVPVIASWNLT
ncbi:MAG TPA: histidine phosphatase family protein [Mycobacteriales bacterium]|nr:histidine phosphatase family protein [Mycobacteriales bacterium]